MKYKKILKELSIKENVPIKEIENEMKVAIKAAGLNCSIKKFMKSVILLLKQDYI